MNQNVLVAGFLILFCMGSEWTLEYENNRFPHLEGCLGWSWNLGGLEAVYLHQYSTPFVYGQNFSSASQSLSLDGQGSMGIQASISYFLKQTFGFQLMGGIFKTPLSGENSPYNFDFSYTALQPPDYIPREFQINNDVDWPDTEGHLKRFHLSLNAAFRFFSEEAVSFLASGGLSYLDVRGLASSLGYSKHWLGGHSVLFNETYHLEFSMGSSKKIGFNLGGEISISLVKNIHMFLAARFFFFGKIVLDLEPERIINMNEIIMQHESLEQIKQILDLPPLTIPSNFPQVSLGIKMSLF